MSISQLHRTYEPMRSCLICKIMLPWQLEGAVCSAQINVSAGNSRQGLIFVSAGPRLDTDRELDYILLVSVMFPCLLSFISFCASLIWVMGQQHSM